MLPQSTKVPRICEVCGKEFFVWPSTLKQHPCRWCSRACQIVPLRLALPTRFWAKVQKTATCWLWTGTRTRQGYGQFAVDKRTRASAHRMAYELTHGPIPEGLDVLHKCDNPPCCNPEHLFLGTHQDNMIDAVHKGRLRGTKKMT